MAEPLAPAIPDVRDWLAKKYGEGLGPDPAIDASGGWWRRPTLFDADLTATPGTTDREYLSSPDRTPGIHDPANRYFASTIGPSASAAGARSLGEAAGRVLAPGVYGDTSASLRNLIGEAPFAAGIFLGPRGRAAMEARFPEMKGKWGSSEALQAAVGSGDWGDPAMAPYLWREYGWRNAGAWGNSPGVLGHTQPASVVPTPGGISANPKALKDMKVVNDWMKIGDAPVKEAFTGENWDKLMAAHPELANSPAHIEISPWVTHGGGLTHFNPDKMQPSSVTVSAQNPEALKAVNAHELQHFLGNEVIPYDPYQGRMVIPPVEGTDAEKLIAENIIKANLLLQKSGISDDERAGLEQLIRGLLGRYREGEGNVKRAAAYLDMPVEQIARERALKHDWDTAELAKNTPGISFFDTYAPGAHGDKELEKSYTMGLFPLSAYRNPARPVPRPANAVPADILRKYYHGR